MIGFVPVGTALACMPLMRVLAKNFLNSLHRPSVSPRRSSFSSCVLFAVSAAVSRTSSLSRVLLRL